MARRKKNSPLDDIFEMFLQLPWWIGLPAAPIIYYVGNHLGVGKPPELKIIYDIAFPALAVAALIGGIGSFFRSLSRKKLLNKQQGIETVRNLSWRDFEYLVGEIFRRQGYDVVENGGGGADGGVDLILHGRKGKVLVQCKRWKTQKVGVDKVRELFGVVTAERASLGILVSSGRFTKEALAFASGKSLRLIDGAELTRLIREVQTRHFDLPEPTPDIEKESDSNPVCPQCGEAMVLRTAKRGPNTGNQFYGCTQYPKCRGTLSL